MPQRRHCLAAVLSCLLPVCALAQPRSAPPPPLVAFTGASLVDPVGARTVAGARVLVRGERIVAVGDATLALPEGTVEHALDGRFLLAGLIDAHTHVTPLFATSREAMYRELERMLDGGVVAARDMAGDARVVGEVRRAVIAGERRGPELQPAAVFAGPAFSAKDFRMRRVALGHAPGTVPWAQAVDGDTELPLAVARAAGSGAVALKLYLGLEPDVIAAAAAEAKRQGLAVWAHATVYPSRPLEVVRGGAEVLSHACGLAWQDPRLDPRPFAAASIENRPQFDPALVDPDGPAFAELFAEMARRGVLLDPTLSNHGRPGDDEYGCTPELTIALTRAARRAGVGIVAGTDYATPPGDPWPALHAELRYLVNEAGFGTDEALAAATATAARALGREADLGAIAPGRLASFVVLGADPRADIDALGTIAATVVRGRLEPRAERARAQARR
jgi:hypothetical protein